VSDDELLAQVSAPHFTAGIVLRNDRVTEAPRILRYMRGWSRDRVRDYCKNKAWAICVVKQYEQER
jgi:hypothetical protein